LTVCSTFWLDIHKMKTAICYHRISNGKSGGLDSYSIAAQGEITKGLCERENMQVLGSFDEVETGTVGSDERPELAKAIALAKSTKSCLVFSRLDRLARNAEFLLNLQNTGLELRFCDMPEVKDRFTLGVLALLAEQEARNCSIRTKTALKKAREAGKVLGNPRLAEARQTSIASRSTRAKEFNAKIRGMVEQIKAKAHVSALREIAEILNLRAVKTSRGGLWTAQNLWTVLNAVSA
jgi:DNA invertase Pin-like site-specific DNA recombinase